MRRHLSILMLAARGCVAPLLGILALLAAAETGLVWWTLRAPVETDEYLGPFGPEDLLEQSHIALVCAVCFLLLCAALARNGCNRGGVRLDYTLGRLSVGEKTQTAWWSVCNIACLLIFWAFQAALAWGLCGWCAAQLEAAAANEQAVFLAFYRSRFLHSLLPLAEVSRYVRNGILAVCLGICAACFACWQRRGKKGAALVVLALLTVWFFPAGTGAVINDMLLSAAALALIGYTLYNLWLGVREDA